MVHLSNKQLHIGFRVRALIMQKHEIVMIFLKRKIIIQNFDKDTSSQCPLNKDVSLWKPPIPAKTQTTYQYVWQLQHCTQARNLDTDELYHGGRHISPFSSLQLSYYRSAWQAAGSSTIMSTKAITYDECSKMKIDAWLKAVFFHSVRHLCSFSGVHHKLQLYYADNTKFLSYKRPTIAQFGWEWPRALWPMRLLSAYSSA